MSGKPLLLYIPGLLPKPEAGLHRAALKRCLVAGVRRIDPDVADRVAGADDSFDIVSWTFDFYGEHRDFGIDAAAIDALIAQPRAVARDLRDAVALRSRLLRLLFRLADRVPVLIPYVAGERMQLHLRDLRRYARNADGAAEHTRDMARLALRSAAEAGRPILLLAHSMGSVIAYEALWQLSHVFGEDARVDLLVTMGSPLGQRYIRRRIAGSRERGARRYPHNVDRWINLAALGDLTAIDPVLADDFAEMQSLGLVRSIEDHALHNYFRLHGDLNVHSEYGYLINPITARIVTDWWRSHA